MATNPYAAIARLPANVLTAFRQQRGGIGGNRGGGPTLDEQGQPITGDYEVGGAFTVNDDALRSNSATAGFQSKWSNAELLPDGSYRIRMQRPGGGAYDLIDAIYRKDPASGELVLQGQPREFRQESSLSSGIKTAAIPAAFVAGGAALANAAGIGAAGASGAASGSAATGGAAAGGASGAAAGSGASLGSSIGALGQSALPSLGLEMAAPGLMNSIGSAGLGTLGAGSLAAIAPVAAGAAGAGGGTATLGAGGLASPIQTSGALAPVGAAPVPTTSALSSAIGTLPATSTFGAAPAGLGGLANAANSAIDTIGGYLPSAEDMFGSSGIGDWLRIGGALLPAIGGIAMRPGEANTDGISGAAEANRRIGSRLEGMAGDQFTQLTDLFREFEPVLRQQMTQSIADQNTSRERGDSEWNDYVNTYRPVGQRMASMALDMANPARGEQEAARAAGETTTAFDRARQESRRSLEMSGASQQKIAALESAGRLSEAKAIGGVQGNARRDTESRAMQYLSGAANFGQNVQNNSTQLAQLSDAQGNRAVTIGNNTLEAARVPATSAAGIYGNALTANNSSGSLLSAANRDQAASDAARNNSTLGGLAGTARIIGSLFGP